MGFRVKHIVEGENYRFNTIACIVTGNSMNGHLEFQLQNKGVGSRWNDSMMKIPPARRGIAGKQITEAFVQPNASSPSTVDNIETIVTYNEIDSNNQTVLVGRTTCCT
jgi:hypothetical protein